MTKSATTRRVARRFENNDAFRVLVRVGYASNGVLHVLIGLLALQVAFGEHASADQTGPGPGGSPLKAAWSRSGYIPVN